MNVKYEIRNLTREEANAFFFRVPNDDMNPVVDLQTQELSTMGAVASTHPRNEDAAATEAYLVLEPLELKKARHWWDSLRRMDIGGVTYTILEGEDSLPQNSISAIAINGDDHHLYHLAFDDRSQVIVPSPIASEHGAKLGKKPLFGWNDPLVQEPIESGGVVL